MSEGVPVLGSCTPVFRELHRVPSTPRSDSVPSSDLYPRFLLIRDPPELCEPRVSRTRPHYLWCTGKSQDHRDLRPYVDRDPSATSGTDYTVKRTVGGEMSELSECLYNFVLETQNCSDRSSFNLR